MWNKIFLLKAYSYLKFAEKWNFKLHEVIAEFLGTV